MTYRRTAPWARRIWIAIHFRPPPPLALWTMPRYYLKRHRVEGRQYRRRLKVTFRTPGAKGARLPRAPSSAPSRTLRRNHRRFRRSVRLGPELEARRSLAPLVPRVLEVAVRRPQDRLPLGRCLLRHHVGVVHRVRGGSRRRRTAVHIRRAQRAARRGYVEMSLGRTA